MFVTKNRFEWALDCKQREIDALQSRYWELRHAHERLLKHLGLFEETKPAQTVLLEKGGPERS